MKSHPNYRVSVEIVLRKNNKVLLAKRADNCAVAPGVWNVPAGKVKYEEIPIHAAVRESKEEIGLDVTVIDEIGCRAFSSMSKDEQMFRLVYTYLVEQKNPDETVVLNEEHSELAWVDINEITQDKYNSLMKDLKQIIIERALKQQES